MIKKREIGCVPIENQIITDSIVLTEMIEAGNKAGSISAVLLGTFSEKKLAKHVILGFYMFKNK